VGNKIANFTDETLANYAPEHFGAMMTIGRFVKCLLGEEVAVSQLLLVVLLL
jgi:hypothetical protein